MWSAMRWPFLAAGLLAACGTDRLPQQAADGAPLRAMPGSGDAAVVWVFVAADCPIANAMAPEIQSIADDFAARRGRLLVVQVDQTLADAAALAHARDHGYRVPVVVDRQHAMVRAAGATMTPEAAVWDGAGRLRYLGRIDDRFPDLGTRRPQPTTRELRDALAAVLAGRPVAAARVPAVGCVIEAAAGR